MNNIIETALQYLKKGWSVVPAHQTTKRPLGEWKERQKTRLSKEELLTMFEKYPNANVGIITGRISGVSVVDVDVKDGAKGLESLKKLNLPPTYTVQTGSGGFHLYYAYKEGLSSKNGILPGIDIRSDGGFIVTPPSIHPKTKKPYVVTMDIDMEVFPADRFPKEIQEKSPPGEWKKHLANGAKKNERNDTLASFLGGLMLTFEPDDWEMLYQFVWWWNNSKVDPPLPKYEVDATFKSVGAWAVQHKWNGNLFNK